MKCAKLSNTCPSSVVARLKKDRVHALGRAVFRKIRDILPISYAQVEAPHFAPATRLGRRMGTAQSALLFALRD